MPATTQRLDDVRARHVARAEDPQRHERLGGRRLAGDERGEQRDREPAAKASVAASPSRSRRPGRRSCRRRSISAAVTSAAPVTSAPAAEARGPRSLLEHAQGHHGGGDADRDVDEEDPVPVIAPGSARRRPAGRPSRRPRRRTRRRRSPSPARRGSGNIVTIIPRMTAEVIAPPTPWTKRAMISIASFCATPHSSDAVVKTPRPARNTSRREIRSPSRPGEQQQAPEGDQVGVDDPGEARLGEAEVVLDGGSATFTTVASRTIISMPTHRTTSATQRARSCVCCVVGGCVAVAVTVSLQCASGFKGRTANETATGPETHRSAPNRRHDEKGRQKTPRPGVLDDMTKLKSIQWHGGASAHLRDERPPERPAPAPASAKR